MSIEFTCAECGATVDVADNLAGRKIRCRKCDTPGWVLSEPGRKRTHKRIRWVWAASQVVAAVPMLFGAVFLLVGWSGSTESMVAGVFACLLGLVILAAGKLIDFILSRLRS